MLISSTKLGKQQQLTATSDRPAMRLLINIFLFATLVGCSNRQADNLREKATIDKAAPTVAHLSITNASFPLSLTDINFQDTKNIEVFNDGIEATIERTISDIYYNDCNGDINQTFFSIDDAYIGTIRLRDSLQSIFMVIFQHMGGKLDSKILFYDMVAKEFAESILDFNIHGLYDFDNLKLRPTNLKEDFKITTPEIELVDFDKDGVHDYKFTRLYHNGTANAIETTVIKVTANKIDTLDFKQKWIGLGTDKPRKADGNN